MQEPVERILGETILESTGAKETHYAYEVPLLLSLQQLLCDPFIFDEVCCQFGGVIGNVVASS